MSDVGAERGRDLGSFIRQQRHRARLSLRHLSELAGVSNPYLSQIERGLRRPSADILQQLARALRISAETLYVHAGILDPPGDGTDLVGHILADPHLSEEHKQVMVHLYRTLRRESDAEHAGDRMGTQAPGGVTDGDAETEARTDPPPEAEGTGR